MRYFKIISELVRLDDWLGKAKGIVLILLLYYLILPFPVIYFLHSFIFSALALSYIFLINDFFDIEADKMVGKERPIQHIPIFTARIIIIGLLAVTVIYYLIFFQLTFSALFALVILLLAGTFYSAWPFRFKIRGLFGLAIASLCQRTLVFIAIIFGIFADPELALVVYFSLTTFLVGIMVIISHQIRDRENDRKSGIRTWATQNPLPKVNLFYKWLYIPTLITIFLFLPLAANSYSAQPMIISILYFVVLFV